jgi:hypothetical protein
MRLRRQQSARQAAFERVLAAIEVLREEAERRRENVLNEARIEEGVDYGLEVVGPHVADSPEQYAAAENALTLVGYLWAALQIDDDQLIAKVLLPDTLARLGNSDLRPAARVRQALGLTQEACRQVGCALSIRVLADGSFVVLCFQEILGFGGIQGYGDGRKTIRAWALLIEEVDGRWWIVGRQDGRPGHRVVGLIDVIPLTSDLPMN